MTNTLRRVVLGLGLALFGAAATTPSVAAEKPNIVFMLADNRGGALYGLTQWEITLAVYCSNVPRNSGPVAARGYARSGLPRRPGR